MAKWVEIRKGADFQSIGEKFGISSLTARLIRNKDITEESEIRQYLYGGLSDLCSAAFLVFTLVMTLSLYSLYIRL